MVPCSTWAHPETYWFVHPLLAEVLEAGLLPEERRALHEAFVEALDGLLGLGRTPSTSNGSWISPIITTAPDTVKRRTDGRCSVSEAAGRAGGAKEMLRLLRRAFDLWPDVRHAEP